MSQMSQTTGTNKSGSLTFDRKATTISANVPPSKVKEFGVGKMEVTEYHKVSTVQTPQHSDTGLLTATNPILFSRNQHTSVEHPVKVQSDMVSSGKLNTNQDVNNTINSYNTAGFNHTVAERKPEIIIDSSSRSQSTNHRDMPIATLIAMRA